MNTIRFSHLSIGLVTAFALQSCGSISETGPIKSNINHSDGSYELITVKAPGDVPAPQRVLGLAELPPVVAGPGFSDEIKERDYLLFVIADLSEQSPFFTNGEPYKYGPIEVSKGDGILIPYVGEIEVVGRNLSEVSSAFAEKMKPVSKTAQVTVVRTQRFLSRANVLGEVRSPGPSLLDRSGITSIDILSGAGGPSGPEHLYHYVLRRNGKNYSFDYKGFMENPFGVEAADLITVKKDHSNRIYVMGAITNPIAVPFPVPEPTLADAIGAAYGFDERRSDPSGVFVFRKGEPNQVYTFNMKDPQIFQLAQRFPLAGEDVVYVTEAPLSRWNRMLTQILPIAISQGANSAARYRN